MANTVLLDIDGTLVNSNDLHAQAWQDALRSQGFEVGFAQIRPLIGMGGDKLIPLLTGLGSDSERGQSLAAERTRVFLDRYLARVEPLPGARALLEALVSRGHQLVVATSAKSEELRGLLKRGGIADLLPLRTSADDAEGSKPDPDIVLAALAKANTPAHAALMLGDTPYDLEAATRSGVGFVGVTCGGHDAHALRDAVALYADPRDLLAKLDSSPFAAHDAHATRNPAPQQNQRASS